MDDLMLQAKLDAETTLTVSPIDAQTYAEYVGEENLGGNAGYFVLRTSRGATGARFEVLAKAPSFEAAGEIFDLIVSSRRRA